MTANEFEKLVNRGIEEIPKRFLEKLSNVAIVVEFEPNETQKRKLKIGRRWALFGLYEGVPQSARGANYGGVLPDKITIFRKPIEETAESEEKIKEIIKNTVWHEIAHHFGIDEKGVRQAEARKRRRARDCHESANMVKSSQVKN